MPTSKYRTSPLILKVFIAVCGIGTLAISFLTGISFLNSSANTTFMGMVMFLFMSFLYLYFGAGSIKKFTFDEHTLRIDTCFGLLKVNFNIKEIKGCRSFPYKTKYELYPGMAIAVGDKTYHLSDYEFENYQEIEHYLKQNYNEMPEIKLVFWTTLLKCVVVSFAMFLAWVVASIIFKI